MPRAKTHLTYGESGTFKTTNAGFFAKYIWKKYRKRTRLISADGGGWAPIQHYIDAGLIIPWAIGSIGVDPTKKASPMVIVRKLSRGQWPKVTKIAGKEVLQLQPTTPEEFAEIGGYIVEGLTSIGDLEMEELRRDQRQIGEDAVGKFSAQTDLSSEVETFSANNRAHYNFVQNEIFTMVRAFGSLPVNHVLFTAHEGKGEDEGTREAIRGPAIVGKAATGKVPSWVGDCIHYESYIEPVTVEVTEGGKKFQSQQQRSVVRAYFTRHPDQRFPNIYYPAKPRVVSELIPELFKKWPGGYFKLETDKGLDEFLAFEEELEQKALEQLKASL